MNDKIQELTDRLYSQGLSKGKAEGERLVEDARKQAAGIIADARTEAERIVAAANEESADIISKTRSDVRMASEQAVTATRQTIENLIDGAICSEPSSLLLKDTDFLKTLILEVARNFSAQESKEMEIILPESTRKELDGWVRSELSKTLSAGVSAAFSSRIKGGFNIGPKDGGWFISFTDETLKSLIGEYIRPVTRKLLFGE